MYEELIANLRNCAETNSLSRYKRELMKQAADAIEELSKRETPMRVRRMRLTIRNSDGTVSQPMNLDWSAALEKLAAYEDAEEQGRLVILPVKAGDTVYQLRDKKHALGVGVHPRHISCVCVYGNDWIAEHQGDKPCAKKDLGKTWFLSREEAEAALKGERKDA